MDTIGVNSYTSRMSTLPDGTSINTPDFKLAPLARSLWDAKAKPQRSLGKLEDLAVKIACIRRTLHPVLGRPILLLAAADHGVVSEGVTGSPQEITWQQCENFSKGGGAIGLMCAHNGIDLVIVDMGVAHDFSPGCAILNRKIAYGSANLAQEPAMTLAQCRQALATGRELVAGYAAEGRAVIAFGEMGVGNTTVSSALMAALTGLPVAVCTGEGSGLDAEGLAHKRSIVQQALSLHAKAIEPLEILSCLGGFEIACIVGGLLEAAAQGMVVLMDGFITTVALLVASKIDPKVLDYVVFCHESHETGHRLLIEYLGGEAVLKLGMCLGEGTGAALAWLVIEEAVLLFNGMTSFSQGSVTDSVSLLKAKGVQRAPD
jgi:nicotinate-nucleotide--dimethylbenzimidazole phosphoribosyltransferase